jgi:hypothetical protein
MPSVMRDPAADHKRRDAMAMAAAPFLHSRLTAIDPKLGPAETSVVVRFVVPGARHNGDDQE